MQDKRTLTVEALETRLRRAKNAAAGVHAHLMGAVAEFEALHSGAEITMYERDLKTLETAINMALLYAEEIGSQVKREVERVETTTAWGVSPEEFGRKMDP